MSAQFTEFLLKSTAAKACEEVETIQSLWSGYGRIVRYQLHGSKLDTVVVKFISLNQASSHPRGWNSNRSHNRKVKSYAIETHWYEKWSQDCDRDCLIPSLLGSYSEGEKQWIILEDLNKHFPLRKYELHLDEVKVCLKWLAHFHATFLNRAPNGLWPIGTYWHLDTRPDELEKIEYQELKSKASQIDKLLNNCQYKTIVHGDAKLANFCFSEDGQKVAAVDFQYVGGGCGMKDVAYFLGSCLTAIECSKHEEELLAYYFSVLKNSVDSKSKNIDSQALEKEWREMYPIACTDFTRFLLGWMPSHQKINKYNLKMVNSVLAGISTT